MRFGGHQRLSWIAMLGLGVVTACARIAGLDDTGPGTKGRSSSTSVDADAGSLEPTPEGATISPRQLTVAADCNVEAEREVSIENTSTTPLDYELRVASSSLLAFKDDQGKLVQTLTGRVDGKKVATIVVVAKGSKAGTIVENITITTGLTERVLPVEITVNGAALTLTPSLVDFGEVRQGEPTAPQEVTLTNEGNAPITITGWTATPNADDFSLTSGSITLAPAEKKTTSATFKVASAVGAVSAKFDPVPQGSLVCGALPTLELKGTRADTTVTITPASLDFGTVSCGGSASPKTITISNFDTSSTATVDITLANGSPFTTSTTRASALPRQNSSKPPGTTTVNIGLGALNTPGTKTESIPFKITGPRDETKLIAASVSVDGAFLEVSATSLAFTASPGTQTLKIKNSGNDIIVFDVVPNGDFALDPTTIALFPGFTDQVKVSVRPGSGTKTGNLTFRRRNSLLPPSGTLCPPPTVNLTATLP